MTIAFFGYCETAYCSEVPYGGGHADHGSPAQVLQVVVAQPATPAQVAQSVRAMPAVAAQVLQQVVTNLGTWAQVGQQIANQEAATGVQANQVVQPGTHTPAQVTAHIGAVLPVGGQVLQTTATPNHVGAQVHGVVLERETAHHMSVLNDKLAHHPVAGYCDEPYCGVGYNSARMGAFAHAQVHQFNKQATKTHTQVQEVIKPEIGAHMQVLERVVDDLVAMPAQIADTVRRQDARGAQIEQVIKEALSEHAQVRMVVKRTTPVGAQALMLRGSRTPTQITQVIYNTKRLRILDTFPSRGTAALGGQNWTSTPVQANIDFGPNNLNTDVPEQVFQSPDGTASFVSLVCDTGLPQGVFLDTLAILNHNLTRGAVVSLQGSNDGFATIGVNITLAVTTQDMYYIAPEMPKQGWRYWRLNIIDANNPDTFVRIGIVVFGAAKIFSMAEQFTQPITAGLKHFKDTMATEGYTAVANDRALRRFLRLQFQELAYNKNNYRLLDAVFKSARTTSKVLWIPTPASPERYAVFAKLEKLPELSVTSNEEDGGTDYITLSVELDESL